MLDPVDTGVRQLLTDRWYRLAAAAGVAAAFVLGLLLRGGPGWHWPPAPVALLYVVVAPVLEEIVFRAGLQDAIAARWTRAWAGLTAANLATALLFAALHLWRHPPLWAAATALPALVFGAAYERHGRRLAAPVGLHALYNAAYLTLVTAG